MKQNITWEQLAECKKPGTLLRWMEKRGYNGYRMPPQGEVEPLLPNIGQMIEYLNDRDLPQFTSKFMERIEESNIELCDALWNQVKQVLEGEKV